MDVLPSLSYLFLPLCQRTWNLWRDGGVHFELGTVTPFFTGAKGSTESLCVKRLCDVEVRKDFQGRFGHPWHSVCRFVKDSRMINGPTYVVVLVFLFSIPVSPCSKVLLFILLLDCTYLFSVWKGTKFKSKVKILQTGVYNRSFGQRSFCSSLFIIRSVWMFLPRSSFPLLKASFRFLGISCFFRV